MLHILTSWFPLYESILLFYLIFHPILLYIYCLGTFLSDRISDNTFGSRVICSDWGLLLGKTELIESDVEGYSCLSIVKHVPQLLLQPRTPPRVLVLLILCGLVHFMGVGGVELLQGQMVDI